MPLTPVTSGLQLELDSTVGVYKDTGKTTPATTTGDVVAAWADQSGNGYDALQATTANQPKYTTAGNNSQPAIDLTVSTFKWLTVGAATNLNIATTGAVTIFVAAKPDSNVNAFAYNGLISGSGGAGNAPFCLCTDSSSGIQRFGGTCALPAKMPANTQILAAYQAVGAANSRDYAEYLWSNGGKPATDYGYQVAFGGTNWVVGKGINGFSGKMQGAWVWNRALSISEIETHAAYVAAKFGGSYSTHIAPSAAETPAGMVVFVGDSITAGTGPSEMDNKWTFKGIRDSSLVDYIKGVNLGVSGRTLAQLVTTPTDYDSARPAAGKYGRALLMCFAATNDFAGPAGAPPSVATVYGLLTTFCRGRRATGWQGPNYKIGVATILPRNSTFSGSANSSNFSTNRAAWNIQLRADFGIPTQYPNIWLASPGTDYADVMVDWASDVSIGPDSAASGANFADGTHPSDAGAKILAGYFTNLYRASMQDAAPRRGTLRRNNLMRIR